jgi:DNA-binding transcriptional LysR family regulator
LRIDPNLLVILALLLKTRSVTNTAVLLKVSQPKVSRALSQLRELLEDPLLVRTRGGMTLTRRAEDLAEPLQEWLAATSSLLEAQQFEPESLVRRFRVASTDFGVLAVVAPVLSAIAETAPGAAIDVVPLKGAMADDLAHGEVDLLISGLDSDASNPHERFLFTEDFSCLFREGHPLAGNPDPVCLGEFLDFPHISLTVGELSYDRIDSRLGEAATRRRIMARLPYFGAAPLIVGSSDALVTLPTRAAKTFAEACGLLYRPAPLEIGTFDYRLVWHSRSARDPALAWLRARLLAPFEEADLAAS